jgi:hypothetical protein
LAGLQGIGGIQASEENENDRKLPKSGSADLLKMKTQVPTSSTPASGSQSKEALKEILNIKTNIGPATDLRKLGPMSASAIQPQEVKYWAVASNTTMSTTKAEFPASKTTQGLQLEENLVSPVDPPLSAASPADDKSIMKLTQN